MLCLPCHVNIDNLGERVHADLHTARSADRQLLGLMVARRVWSARLGEIDILANFQPLFNHATTQHIA